MGADYERRQADQKLAGIGDKPIRLTYRTGRGSRLSYTAETGDRLTYVIEIGDRLTYKTGTEGRLTRDRWWTDFQNMNMRRAD